MLNIPHVTKARLSDLKTCIAMRFDSESEMARLVGWDRNRLNRITTGAKVPSLLDVTILSMALRMTLDEVTAFFLE